MDTDTAVLERADRTDGPTDHVLVRAVRQGDDFAFEALYTRYQRRIAAYVYGMVKDYGRAEDITQEVFVSALRRMRETERPIVFKPWVYEIAKNACIDAYRRGRHAEEVSFEADDRLSASDYGRLVATGPSPDSAVDTKQDLDHLCGAFGGLSDTHHQILVMRELEGLSYKDIGDRMGMSRPAVESTLFRARKRLGEEYDELASGARCLRVQTIIADSEGARLGLRDRRKLARHVSHCQPCRRLAANAGLDIAIPVRTRVAEKLAGLLPLPGFLRLRRGGGGDAVAATGGSGGPPSWTANLPAFAEPLQSGWGKAAAGLTALLVAGAGAGVTTTMTGDKRDERGTDARTAAVQRPAGDSGGTAPARAPVSTIPATADRRKTTKTSGSRKAGKVRRNGTRAGDRGASGSKSLGGTGTERADAPTSNTTTPDRAAGGGTDERAGGARTGDGGGDTSKTGSTPPRDPDGSSTTQPPADGGGGAVQQPVQQAVNNVDTTVQNATTNLGNTVQQAGQDVQKVLTDPQNLLPNVTDTATNALTGVGTTVDTALTDVGKTVGDLLKPKPNG